LVRERDFNMASEKLDEKAIFNVARQIVSEEARAEYLHHVCDLWAQQQRVVHQESRHRYDPER
jgi:hypothetical protein